MKRILFLASLLVGLALALAPIEAPRVIAQTFPGQTSPGYVPIGQGSAQIKWLPVSGCALTSAGALTCPGAAITSPIPLSAGGLGASQSAATANQIPVYPGGGGAAVPTGAPTWFNNAYCNTIGYLIVRMANAWTCNNSIPANVDWFANVFGNGSTDDTAGIQAVLNAVNGIVQFSSKHYCIKSGGGLTTTMANQQLIGSRGTLLDSCGADLSTLTINADSIVVRDMSINGAGLSVSTNHNVLNFGTACVRCRGERLDIAGGYYNILINAPYTALADIRTGNAHGPAVIKLITSSGSVPGVFLNGINQIDQAWPVSVPSNLASISAWASNHNYTTTGTVVSTGGYYIQLSSGSCTSNNGSAPTLLDYGNSITDGTCTWKLVAPTTFYGLDIDTGSVNVFVSRSDFTGPYTAGVHLQNSGAGSAPIEVILGYGNTWSGNITASIQADAGSMLQIDKAQIQNGVLAGHVGIWLKSTFTGNYTIDSVIMLGLGNSSDGILDQAGASNGGTIANNLIYTGGGTGISIGANINNRTITGNHAGSSSLGSNSACIFVSPGTGDYLHIIGNDCNGATSTGVTLTSVTGTHNISLNGGASAATMQAFTEQGMTLLSVGTLSNQATFTDTGDFSANYDDYLIVISNVVPVTNATTLQLQVHSGGSYQATTYLNGSALTTAVDVCNNVGIGNTAGIGVSAEIHIFNVNNANSTNVNKFVRATGTLYNGTTAAQCLGIGFWNGGQGVVDGFQLLFASGNLSTGIVKVYGIRKGL